MDPIIITKNTREEIRLTREHFKGREIFSARTWFKAPDGTMRPGKGGIAFRLDLLPDFAAAVSQIAAEGRAPE